MVTLLHGDWRFFWPENINTIAHIPSAWDSTLNTGLGISGLPTLWITSYLNATASLSKIGFSWNLIGLLFWIIPAVIITFFSAYWLYSSLFPGKKTFSILSGFIYLINTYFILIFGGGQMGVALAYSLSPFVIYRFILLMNNIEIRNSVIFSLSLALLVLFDPRLVFITFSGILLYFVFTFSRKSLTKYFIYLFLMPFIITLLVHSYWVLPLIIFHSSVANNTLFNTQSLAFFSFADFPHTLAMLHPNWPDNLFGKVYFMQPEFLLLPILAYASLLFTENQEIKMKKKLFVFVCLGLIGAFLAKGVHEPFGNMYIWFFVHIPGFQLFRDPTKWYLLITISYSILIPFFLSSISSSLCALKLNKSGKNNEFIPPGISVLFVGYMIFLIWPVFNSKNLFHPTEVPNNYIQLKSYLVKQQTFSRSLWIPTWQRFGFFSDSHPAVSGNELLHKASALAQIQQLQKPATKQLLQSAGISYVIVPFDSNGEIFVKDSVFSKKEYEKTVKSLEKIPWLKREVNFGAIVVYKTGVFTPHISLIKKSEPVMVPYKKINDTHYVIGLRNAKKGDRIIFSETFDRNWILRENGLSYNSITSRDSFNSFVVPANNILKADIYYKPQEFVNYGLFISITTLLCITAFMFMPIIARYKRSGELHAIIHSK